MVANTGYRLTNVKDLFDMDTKKSNITLKSCIESSKENSFEVHKVTGIGLKEYESICEKLVKFLEHVTYFTQVL